MSGGQYTRRVTLPSGRVIDVIYHGAIEPVTAPQLHDLSTCPDCHGTRVYPVEWAEKDATHWIVDRRCPDCEWTSTGIHDQASCDAWDTILDLDRDRLVMELAAMIRARMADDIDRFASALEHGHILPEDF